MGETFYGLFVEEDARAVGYDGLQRSAPGKSDHRTAGGLRLDRHQPEVFDAAKEKRAATPQMIAYGLEAQLLRSASPATARDATTVIAYDTHHRQIAWITNSSRYVR